MTLAEKILAAHTDKKKVKPGEFINVRVDLVLANEAGRPVYNALKRQDEEHLIEIVGKELRKMMPWLESK